jgi:aminoglycoside phosphotransferase (APT) family kinase protein
MTAIDRGDTASPGDTPDPDGPNPPAGPDWNEIARPVGRWAGRGAHIEDATRLPGGASKETWSFDAVAPDGTRTGLILRRDPPGRPSEPGAIDREARALTLAHHAGLPVPELLFSSEGALLGTAGLMMRRIPGETIARKILRDDAYAQARGLLAGQLAQFAAGLHAVDVPDFPQPDPLAGLREQLAAFAETGQHSEVFELALDWLTANPPPAREPVLLHGDFRLGNLIVGPEGLRAVLDWELTHLGNPTEDLGWLCVKAWRFGAGPPVAGMAGRNELLATYRDAGGADISLDELRWWEVLGTLRWGVICMNQAWTHLSGAYRSVELVTIGRRVAEQEWDLLLLLQPKEAAAAAARRPRLSGESGAPGPAPYGRPTAGELLEAVREYLTGQVMPATSGQLAFHARVAANALAIVTRELELGASVADASLADPTLADTVAARLAVANPKYFGEPPAAPASGYESGSP